MGLSSGSNSYAAVSKRTCRVHRAPCFPIALSVPGAWPAQDKAERRYFSPMYISKTCTSYLRYEVHNWSYPQHGSVDLLWFRSQDSLIAASMSCQALIPLNPYHYLQTRRIAANCSGHFGVKYQREATFLTPRINSSISMGLGT